MAIAELAVDRRLRPLRGIYARLCPGCLALALSRRGDFSGGSETRAGLRPAANREPAAALGGLGIRAVELDAGRDDVYYSRYCRHPAALGYPPGLISSQLYPRLLQVAGYSPPDPGHRVASGNSGP